MMDFLAAPSLFREEDLRQKHHVTNFRKESIEHLKAAECLREQVVAVRTYQQRWPTVHHEAVGVAFTSRTWVKGECTVNVSPPRPEQI